MSGESSSLRIRFLRAGAFTWDAAAFFRGG
jgi:hypothetical protein